MPTDPLVLAVDQGTSATKALLVDSGGVIVARASAPLAQAHPHPGWAQQDASELVRSVHEAVAACVDQGRARDVVAVGISNQRESLVLWDRATGEPVGPLLGWQDQRTAELCAKLVAAGAGELVRSVSGLPLDPMFSALEARWLLDTYDAERTASRAGQLCLGTVDSWLLSRFGGPHVTEVGNASRTQLMNVATGEWDERLLELFAVPRGVLADIAPSTGPFPATRGLAPLPDGVPVLAVLGDSHAALFAHGGWQPGVVKATYGTGSSVMAVAGARVEGLAEGLCRTVAWDVDGPVLALEGNIRATGQTISWLAGILGTTPEEVLHEAETATSDGVHIVPAFGGLAAPWWDPDASAVLSGVTLGTCGGNLAAAAVESVAFQVEDVVTAVERASGAVETIVTDGGLTRNRHLMQVQADISGRRVSCSLEPELSALGVAQVAGLRAGLWSWQELVDWPRRAEDFSPTNSPTDRATRRAAWLDAVDRSRRRRSP